MTRRLGSCAFDIRSAATLFSLLTGHAVLEPRQGESTVAQLLRIT
ncbi:hypothetical protein [Nocardia salmonicida]|nr:hypothetical protein [Nocardia salmonicida]